MSQLIEITWIDNRKITSAVAATARNKIGFTRLGVLERLISNILDVSRIVQGKFKRQLQPLTLAELSTLVAVAIDIVTPAAQVKNIEIDFVASDLAAQILGDTDRLQQAMWNLLSNPVKFTLSKGQVFVKMQ